jgi:hypothetical protein
MERGLQPRRFICEHQVVPDLDQVVIRDMHHSTLQGVTVLYTFSNLDEKCMYSVVAAPDRLTVESFMGSLRLPCDSIMEVQVMGEGQDMVLDLRHKRAA